MCEREVGEGGGDVGFDQGGRLGAPGPAHGDDLPRVWTCAKEVGEGGEKGASIRAVALGPLAMPHGGGLSRTRVCVWGVWGGEEWGARAEGKVGFGHGQGLNMKVQTSSLQQRRRPSARVWPQRLAAPLPVAFWAQAEDKNCELEQRRRRCRGGEPLPRTPSPEHHGRRKQKSQCLHTPTGVLLLHLLLLLPPQTLHTCSLEAPLPVSSANWSSAAVGSVPGLSTKSRGVVLEDSA
jgi:hypothetical protein